MRCKLLVSIAISYGQVPAAVCSPYVRACVRTWVLACLHKRGGKEDGMVALACMDAWMQRADCGLLPGCMLEEADGW
jgi:hypothetical protein